MTARVRLTVVAALATLLASLSLGAVFRDGAWFWQVVAAVAVASTGCALGRRMGLPKLLVPVVGLVLLGLLITWLYARDVAVLGFLPGPAALRALDQLAQTGLDGTRRYAAPAPTDPSLVLLAAAGVGLVAVVVDTLAVTYRSAALAGVPLLVLYAVPVTVVASGVPWLLFTVGALGWLALLLAEGRERVSGWGRALDRRSNKGDNVLAGTPPEPLGVVGRRIGAAALGLALVLPAVLPWVTTSLFERGGGGGGGGAGGSGQTTTVNPFVTLFGDLTAKTDSIVLLVHTDDPHPDYLRMVTLDTFDIKKWQWQPASLQQDRPADSLTPPEGADLSGRDVQTEIEVEGLAQQQLPMPYPATGLSGVPGNWQVDDATRDVFVKSGSSFSLRYTVQSRHLDLTPAQLRHAGPPPTAIVDKYTALPAGIPDDVRTLAEQITGSERSAYGKAIALQHFFTDGNHFTYSTKLDQIGSNGTNPLSDFLFVSRKGYCQQFAGAFAVLARLAGLPTRVDIGFTPGAPQATQGDWNVSRMNAHAWPEVYFAGAGWVRFEPTIGGPTGIAGPAWAPPAGGLGGHASGGPAPGVDPHKNQHFKDFNSIGDTGTVQETPTPTPVKPYRFPWAPVLGVLLVLTAMAPGSARLLRRRRRLSGGSAEAEGAGRILAAWREVADTARDLRLPWSAARTPRRTAEWVVAASHDPDALAAARRLARAVERVRYAPEGVDVLAGVDPGPDARLVVAAMERTAPRRERWRARLWPASVLAAAAGRAADVMDTIDVAGARLRRALVRLLPGRGGATAG